MHSNKKTKSFIKSITLTVLIITVAFGFGILLGDVLDIGEHITTMFAFAVFIVALVTDGYFYGIAATVVSVVIINYAFTYPYYNMDFTIPENVFSAIVMLVISFLTSMFTAKLKIWQSAKAESERERMRANLLRAVSHDLRTPLTTIYGAKMLISL